MAAAKPVGNLAARPAAHKPALAAADTLAWPAGRAAAGRVATPGRMVTPKLADRPVAAPAPDTPAGGRIGVTDPGTAAGQAEVGRRPRVAAGTVRPGTSVRAFRTGSKPPAA